MDSKFFLLCLLAFSLVNHKNTIAAPFFLYQYCPAYSTFTPNSTYQKNLNTLLSLLADAAGSATNGFGNNTVGESSSDRIYGVFLCRGDIDNDTCSLCVSYAAQDTIRRNCQTQKTVIMGYDECMLHYSDESISSKLQLEPAYSIYDQNIANVSDPTLFAGLLSNTVNHLIPRTVAGGRGKKFAVAKAPFKGLQTLYTLAQCTPDLTDSDCNECLIKANETLPQGKQEGRVLTPSCSIRFDVNLFYNEAAAAFYDASATENTSLSPPPAVGKRKERIILSCLSVTSVLVMIYVRNQFTSVHDILVGAVDQIQS